MKLTMVASIGLGIVGMSMRPARACLPAFCNGTFVPGERAVVPANLPAILWSPALDSADHDPTRVTLVDAADPATSIPLAATRVAGGYALAPATPLVEGHQYTLTDSTPCSYEPMRPPPTATFTVAAAAPLPAALGPAVAMAPVHQTIYRSAACENDQAPGVSVDLEVALAPEAMPWRDVLLYTTHVDDAVWREPNNAMNLGAPGASWLGRGSDRVFALCGARTNPSSAAFLDSGAGEGTHRVTFDATLAGTSLALASDPASVTLDCGDGCSVGVGAGPLTVLALLGLQRRRRS